MFGESKNSPYLCKMENKWKEKYKNHFENGYAMKEIHAISEIKNMPCETTQDLLNIIDFVEFVREHNVSVYMNTYFSKEEAIKHSDALFHYSKSEGVSNFVQLMRIVKGL